MKPDIVNSQCANCKHYNIGDAYKHSCKAFPEGIPEKVFFNDVIHDHIIKGQVGEFVSEESQEIEEDIF